MSWSLREHTSLALSRISDWVRTAIMGAWCSKYLTTISYAIFHRVGTSMMTMCWATFNNACFCLSDAAAVELRWKNATTRRILASSLATISMCSARWQAKFREWAKQPKCSPKLGAFCTADTMFEALSVVMGIGRYPLDPGFLIFHSKMDSSSSSAKFSPLWLSSLSAKQSPSVASQLWWDEL